MNIMEPLSTISFSAVIRRWDNGKETASRWFITVPKDLSIQIRELSKILNMKPGGMIPIEVVVGFMKWKTSLFYDSQSHGYMIPIKSEVRKKLHLQEGDEIHLLCEILV